MTRAAPSCWRSWSRSCRRAALRGAAARRRPLARRSGCVPEVVIRAEFAGWTGDGPRPPGRLQGLRLRQGPEGRSGARRGGEGNRRDRWGGPDGRSARGRPDARAREGRGACPGPCGIREPGGHRRPRAAAGVPAPVHGHPRAPRNRRVGIDLAGVVESDRPGDGALSSRRSRVHRSFHHQRGGFVRRVHQPFPSACSSPSRRSCHSTTASTLPHSAVLALQGLRYARRDDGQAR
jgi:hypothetical protein